MAQPQRRQTLKQVHQSHAMALRAPFRAPFDWIFSARDRTAVPACHLKNIVKEVTQ
jgi:hypothetical protein